MDEKAKRKSLIDKSLKAGNLAKIGLDIVSIANNALVGGGELAALREELRELTRLTGDFDNVSRKLSEVADRTSSSVTSTVDIFNRVAPAARNLGKSNAEIVQFTEVVQRLSKLDAVSLDKIFAGASLDETIATALGSGDAFDAVLSKRRGLVTASEQAKPNLGDAQQNLGQVIVNEIDSSFAELEEDTRLISGAAIVFDKVAKALPQSFELAKSFVSSTTFDFINDAREILGIFQDEVALHAKALAGLGTSAAEAQTVIRNLTSDELDTKTEQLNAAIQANQVVLDSGGGAVRSAVLGGVGQLRSQQIDPLTGIDRGLPEDVNIALNQIVKLGKAAKDGGNDSIAFANEIIDIADNHTQLEPLAKKLREIVENLTMAGENLEVEKNVRTLIDARIGQGEIPVPVPPSAEQGVGDIGGLPGAGDSIGATTNETIAAAEASKKCLEELAAAANQAREALNSTDVAVKEAKGGQEDLAGATDKTVAATEEACAAVEANRKCLEELATATEEAGAATEKAGAATEMLVQSSAGLGPGLEQESKQLTARAKVVPGLTQQLKKEFDSRNLVARLVQILGRELLPEEIQQLNELIALRDQTVEQLDAEAEARRDVAQAAGEQAEVAAGNGAGGTGGGGGFGIPFVADSEGIAGQIGRPFEIAVGDIQQEFAGLFDRLFEDGIGAFADMGRNIKGIFKNLASNIARTLIFQPQVLGVGGLAGGLGGLLGSIFGSGGGIGNILTNGGILGEGGAFGGGGLSGLLGGFVGGGGSGIGGGVGGLGGSLGSAAGALGPAALGAAAGFLIGSLPGLKRRGAVIGGTLGTAFGPIGSILGAIAGGLLGSLFGGDTSLQLQTGRVGDGLKFEDAASRQTPFGIVGFTTGSEITKTETPQLVEALASVDEAIAGVLLPEQIEAATEALLAQTGGGGATGPGRGTRLEIGKKDFGEKFFLSIQERLTTILDAAIGEPDQVAKAFAQIQPSQENIDLLVQTAVDIIEFNKLLEELTGNAEPLTRAEQQLNALNAQFDELAAQAKRLGADEAKIAKARIEAVERLARDADEINAFELLKLTDPIKAERQALIELQEERLREVEALGANVELLKKRNAAELELFENQRLAADGLRNLLIDLTAGPQSTLPTNVVLTNALERFESLRLSAIGGDFSAREALGDASQDLLAVARDAFASSPQFFDIQQRVIDTLDLLVSANENAAELTAEAIGGEVKAAIEPVLQDIGAESAESNDELRAIKDTLDAITGLLFGRQAALGLNGALRAVPPTLSGSAPTVEGRLASAQ